MFAQTKKEKRKESKKRKGKVEDYFAHLLEQKAYYDRRKQCQ